MLQFTLWSVVKWSEALTGSLLSLCPCYCPVIWYLVYSISLQATSCCSETKKLDSKKTRELSHAYLLQDLTHLRRLRSNRKCTVRDTVFWPHSCGVEKKRSALSYFYYVILSKMKMFGAPGVNNCCQSPQKMLLNGQNMVLRLSARACISTRQQDTGSKAPPSQPVGFLVSPRSEAEEQAEASRQGPLT